LEGFNQAEVAAYFSLRKGGVTRERISQVESMDRVPSELESRYKAALATARWMRARSHATEFENLKMATGR
jgi:hypothetical protein